MSKGRYLVSTLSLFHRATKETHHLAIKFIAKKPEHVRNCEGLVNQGLDRYACLGKGRDFEISDKLRPEQRRAVETVLDSRDLAINVRGAAGTGKTATLREIDRGLSD